MGRPLSILLAAAACTWLGCSESPRDPQSIPAPPVSATVRGIEVEGGSLGTGDFARVEIGTELRTVVVSQPRFLPRWRERVELAQASYVVDVIRPDGVPLAVAAQIDVMISVGDVVQRLEAAREGAAKGVKDADREWIRTQGMLAAGETSARIAVAIPAALVGQSGLLDVILRPLATEAVQTWSMPAVEIEADHVLRFGYGIEEPAWQPGWPAATVRVDALIAREGGEDETRAIFEGQIDPVRDPRDRRWHDAEVPLGDLAGETVTLRFELQVAPNEGMSHSLMALANPVVAPARHAGPRPPARDVVLISLDTLRAPSVSSYGYTRPTTPRMDALLAEKGTRFAQAYAPVPYTPPSHMTMLTGLHPCAHGVNNRHETVGADRPLLAERLRAAGYRTGAVTEDANVAVSSGFARGFDDYYEVRSEESATPGFASETFGRAREWLHGVDGRPFFLFVHTYQVHDPYDPPADYAGMFGDAIEGDVVPERHRAKRDDYDREIRFTDELLADFLGALDEQGLGDAIVIVTSDHGEAFGEHYWANHGFSTHEEAIRVPLLIRAPTLVPAGRIIDARVSLADIVPTVLDLLGLATPEDVQGQSLAPLILGDDPSLEAELGRRALYATSSITRSIITDAQKVTVPLHEKDGEWAHVFDRVADPDERTNLAETRPEDVEAGRRALSAFEAACAAFVEAHPSRPGDTFLDGNQPAWMINRDVIEERLRSLGYIE